MSQPVEGSALQNVFGSHVSLAELNGDVSRPQSRIPSRATTPPLAAHDSTKRARSRTITKQNRPVVRRRSAKSLALRFLLLYVAGLVVCTGIAHFVALGRFGSELATVEPRIHPLVLQGAGVFAVLTGMLFVKLDGQDQSLGKLRDWNALVRGAGAVLGLCYATTKISSTWVFWGLANPILWYIIDASPLGFILSAAISVVGASLTVLSINVTSWHDTLLISASYFSAAILWGNLGRRLLAVERR